MYLCPRCLSNNITARATLTFIVTGEAVRLKDMSFDGDTHELFNENPDPDEITDIEEPECVRCGAKFAGCAELLTSHPWKEWRGTTMQAIAEQNHREFNRLYELGWYESDRHSRDDEEMNREAVSKLKAYEVQKARLVVEDKIQRMYITLLAQSLVPDEESLKDKNDEE